MNRPALAEEAMPDLESERRGPAGGGEAGALVRRVDWGATPLGPVQRWPQSLRTTVDMLLANRFPMLLMWGADLIQICNDAYRPIYGATKYPGAMGRSARETWAEIWDVIGPMTVAVMERGESVYLEDLPLMLDRNGYLEETSFTYAYSPIRDEAGEVGGLLVTVNETTQRVLGERRLRTLRDLAARSLEAESAEEACRRSVAVLGENTADLPFALLYLLGEDGAARLADAAGLEPGVGAAPTTVDLEPEGDSGWPLAAVARGGRAAHVADLSARFGELPGGPWPEPPREALVLPVARPGQERPYGVLVAGVSSRRALDEEYRAFLTAVAVQVAAAVSDARAFETVRRLNDTLERRVLERTAELEVQARALAAFSEFTEAVGAQSDVPALSRQAVELVVRAIRAEAAVYYVLEGNVWRARAMSEGLDQATRDAAERGFPADTPMFAAAREGAVFSDGEALSADLPEAVVGEFIREFSATAILPVVAGGELRGLFTVGLKAGRRWVERDRAVVRAVARGLALSVERAEATARLEAQRAELEERNAEAETFVYTVSHDLRTPLLSIQGMSALLTDAVREGDPDGAAFALGRVTANVERMGRLLDDLLTLSGGGGGGGEAQPLDLGAVVEAALEPLAARVAARDVSVELPPTWPRVRYPQSEAEQAVGNLIGNAVKWAGRGRPGERPRVAVSWETAGDWVTLRVSDNGPGVPPEFRERVFGLFVKLDPSAEGTGVGLAIVKRIAERHGGRAWVEDSPLGGATFAFTLPLERRTTP